MVFSFLSCKKQHDAATYLRRLLDLTVPNPPVASEYRSGRRHNRSLPILLGPFDPDGQNQDDFQFAMTKDIVDFGLGIITTNELAMEEVTFAVWIPADDTTAPYYFRGTVQSCAPMGGPFWQVGIEIQDFLNAEYPQIVENLAPLAAQLVVREEGSYAGTVV